MAATATIKKRFKFGNGFCVVADVTLDSSYPTGGEAVSAEQLDLSALEFVQGAASGGYVPEYDHANEKLKAYYADCDYAGDKALIEVANATDLSAVTFRLMALGY